MLMKKLLFAAHTLEMGGIEKALVTLLNQLVQEESYEITLVLQEKKGLFADMLDKRVKIIEYKGSNNSNPLFRKLLNVSKRIKFMIQYYHRFDFSASFATYSKMASFVARMASANSHLWGHADYLELFQDPNKVKEFFQEIHSAQFKRVVFVSEEGKESYEKLVPHARQEVLVCNNLLDEKQIKEMAKETIPYQKDSVYTFLNIGRHDEKQKRLSRLIQACQKLQQEGLDFRVYLIGQGPDTALYQKMVKQDHLESKLIFLGQQKNPYPYYQLGDAVVLTSDYEGFPVVFLESMLFKVPILTTPVSGSRTIVERNAGIVVPKKVEDIAEKMKWMIQNRPQFSIHFDAKKYNEEIIKKIEKMF